MTFAPSWHRACDNRSTARLAALLSAATAVGGCWVYSPYGRAVAYGPQQAVAPSGVAFASQVATPLAVGSAVQGQLDATDPRNERGNAFDDYVVQLTAGVPVVIDVRAGPAFNSYAGGLLDVYTYLLFNGMEVARDDDGGGYPHSRIVYTPAYSGPFVIRVSSFGTGLREGAYTVMVRAGPIW